MIMRAWVLTNEQVALMSQGAHQCMSLGAHLQYSYINEPECLNQPSSMSLGTHQ